MLQLLDTALAYHRAGLTVLPNDPTRKYPVGLKGWQEYTPTEADVRRWFANGTHAIGVRDTEGIDIDNKGHPDAETLYTAWAALVEQLAPGLVDTLLCERTPRGGYHLVWRCEEIAGNQKLATRPPTVDELRETPKLTAVSLIETRGRGGQFQVAPSPGYTLVRGDWCKLPTISPAERQILLDCARALSRTDRRTIDTLGRSSGERAGDRFNQDGADEAYALLEADGWSVAYERDGAKYLIRPGKGKKGGIGATFGYVAPGVLYVFTTNAAPFQDGRAYGPFAIYAELQHNGDYKAAAKDLYQRHEKLARMQTRVNVLTGEITDGATPKHRPVIDWRTQGITAADLYRAEFAPLIWTVENICPEGATLIAGKPKSRKSWVALAIAVACARGEKVMGRLNTRQGRVLYLDLESNQRRMRGRLYSMIGHKMKDMDNLHIFTEWPRGEEGIAELEAWMAAYPDTVLIIIDVITDFRRPRDPKEDIYAYDRETVKPLNEFAERHRVTVAMIHHTRKAKADDVFDEISGSTGLPSAVATMWVLGRAPNGSGEMILAMRGRDLIHDEPLALEWDEYDNQFKIVGGAIDALQSGERRALLKIMEDDLEWTPKDLAAELKKSVNNVQQLIRALLSDGLIERTGYGKYVRVVDQSSKSSKSSKSINSLNSDLDSVDQSSDQSSAGQQDALKANSYYSDRVLENSAKELFADDCPPGLTPKQWEQANYLYALGRWTDFRRLADETGLGWDKLKALVTSSSGSADAGSASTT